METASDWLPKNAMNNVTLSTVIGVGLIENWDENVWYLCQPARYTIKVDSVTPAARNR